MERLAAWEPQGVDALRRFQGLLLDRRGRLHGQVLRLREVARRLERLRRRSLAANVAGSSLSAAGAVAAIVGLSLSPVTLGASLVASAVGLGVATAGGAVTVTSDLSLIFCSSREVRRVQEIAATCQDQMRELLSCLEFFCQWQGRGDRQLQQSGRGRLHGPLQLCVLHRLLRLAGLPHPQACRGGHQSQPGRAEGQDSETV